MPKRGSNENFDFIVKKLRKLEKEIRRSRGRPFSSSSSSSGSSSSDSSRSPSPCAPNIEDISNYQETNTNPSQIDLVGTLEIPPAPLPVNIEVAPDMVSTAAIEATTSDVTCANPDLSDILGADPSITIEYGPDINKDVATRFCHIATTGLDKDTRKELLKRYLVPENCKDIAAPLLNPEIKGVFTEQVVKRDKAIEARQKQLASGISALGKIISTQLVAQDKNNELIKDLMDVGRILCDIQHYESETRRNFALYSVKRELKDQLSNTKIDKFLFGNNLSETLKTAKAVSKSSFDLKLEIPKKHKGTPVASTSGKNLNWKTRAPARRQPARSQQRHQPPAVRGNVTSHGTSSHNYTQQPKQTRRP